MAEKKKKNGLEELQNELDELKSLLQRTQADFVNYRRRNEEDRAKFTSFAQADLIEQILPILDNFQLAAKHMPTELANNSWSQGIQAIEKQLEQTLITNGLEKIEVVGNEFDHNLAEAIAEESDKKQKNHIVLREEMPGYMLNGKLLRPAKVIVNNNK